MARVKYYDKQSEQWKYADAALNMKGKDGHTPVKGTDYFTDEDKQELTENIMGQGVLTYNEQSLTEEQKAQARENIGIDQISFDKLNEDLDVNGYRIVGLSEPQRSSEPATKGYVDTFAIEANTFVATDDGKGNVTIVPYENDVAEPIFMEHIGNKQNPHMVTAEQIGARPSDWMPTASDVGARPNTWMPTAADVGAATPQAVNATKTEAVTEANTYTDAAVKKAAPRNLLDNSDFRNPVNQRGQTSYASDGYCFDRWVIWHSNGCNVSYDSEKQCVRISSTAETTLYQRLPKGILNQNKKYTQAYGLTGGRVVISTRIDYSPERYDSVEGIMLSTGQTMEIVWTALYEGEYTPETLPEYRPKGYGAELAECQRYYKRIHDAKFVISPNLQTIYRGSSIYFGDMARPDNLTVNMIPDGDGNIGLVQKVTFIPYGTTDLRWDGDVSNTISIATTNEDWAGRQVVLYCIELSAEIL